MNKTKISKTIKERFKITASGKIMHLRGGMKHRRSKERTSLKMRGRRTKELSVADRRKLRRVLL